MRNILLKFKDKRGVALLIVFFVIVILAIYSASFVSNSINRNFVADIFKRRTQAFNLAEAGLDHALVWLRAQGAPPIGIFTDPWGGIQNLGEGTYTVTITDLGPVGADPSIRRYRVNSTGRYAGMNRMMTNYLQVDNFARYLWFNDEEVFNDMPVWFWSQDRLNGPTHTNAHFNIFGSPVFESRAYSADNYIHFFNNGNAVDLQQLTNPPFDLPDFQQGLDFGAEVVTMPAQALSLRSAALNGGFFLQGDTTVMLNDNGTMNVTNAARGWVDQPMALPANGTLFVDGGNLIVSGTLNGRLTVGTSQDIIIPNNIVYADDPRANPNSDDVLGIVSEGDVVIDDNAPFDLEINACIMAMDTSFLRENWWVGPALGTLSIYGGIIQDQRGPIGTFNGATGQKRSGYSKDYAYDQRLLGSPPLFMPTTMDYVTLSWQED